MSISVACQGTCSPWATALDVCSPCDDYAMDMTLLADSLQAASDILFELSGRRFAGVCQDTVRPNGRWVSGDAGRPIGGFSPYGYGFGGYGSTSWYAGWGGCGCNNSRMGCNSVSEITLGAYPLNAISQVKIDGSVLASSRYRIDDNRYLVRLANADGTNPGWPCCQDMGKATTENGTFEVTYVYGSLPPTAGLRACAELACQLALACQPETVDRCRLPKRVTQVTRQGVTAIMLDPYDFLEKNRTGLYLCDLFLQAYNPNGLRRRSTVTNPDLPRRVRRTTSA